MTGNLLRKGYSIEKYFLGGDGSYVIPYLLSGKLTILKPLDSAGKPAEQAEAENDFSVIKTA
jgi:hypothetical protein